MQVVMDNETCVLFAPTHINAATRDDFRAAALAHLDSCSQGCDAIVIDMRCTVELDASGLGILVLVQKRAKERGLSTCLRNAPERVRNLLKLTLLEFLFERID